MSAVEDARRRTVRVGAVPGRSSTIGLLGAHKLDLLLSCPACGHWAEVPMEQAVARLGERRPYDSVNGRCTMCGCREVIVRTVKRPTDGEPPVGMDHLLAKRMPETGLWCSNRCPDLETTVQLQPRNQASAPDQIIVASAIRDLPVLTQWST